MNFNCRENIISILKIKVQRSLILKSELSSVVTNQNQLPRSGWRCWGSTSNATNFHRLSLQHNTHMATQVRHAVQLYSTTVNSKAGQKIVLRKERKCYDTLRLKSKTAFSLIKFVHKIAQSTAKHFR